MNDFDISYSSHDIMLADDEAIDFTERFNVMSGLENGSGCNNGGNCSSGDGCNNGSGCTNGRLCL